MKKNTDNKCEIRAETKLRNGYLNWWCYTHFASARGEGGSKLERCVKADQAKVLDSEKIYIDLNDYPGGVGIWGALEAVYDTKREIHEKGVHVHLRRNEDEEKEVDKTFKEIYIRLPINNLHNSDEWIKLDDEVACAYTASIIFERNIKVIECSHCKRQHIDSDWFAVHYHKKHFCTYCGRDFFDKEHGISNPVAHIQQVFREQLKDRKIETVNRRLVINQADFPGGIQIWASNPAIIWTAQRAEEAGMHVHLFKEKNGPPFSGDSLNGDDTYGYVEIDGIVLDDLMIRYYMVQKSFSYLDRLIVSLRCPNCWNYHFDKGDNAINPHKTHECEHCKHTFNDATRFKGVVSNPIISNLAKLEANYKNLFNGED